MLVKTPVPADEAYKLATSMEMAYVKSVVPFHVVVRANLRGVKEACLKLAREVGLKPGVKFAVRCRRRGRALRSSTEVERALGKAVKEATGAEVDLRQPDVVLRIEVIDGLVGICVQKRV